MTTHYYWIHIPSGQRGTDEWEKYGLHLSEVAKLKEINEWNRISTIGPGPLAYHYWM